MKKMLIFVMTVLILLSACSTPRYKDAEELLAHWAYNGYPKEYCGVWSTDGTPYNLTIGLTDNAAGDKMGAEDTEHGGGRQHTELCPA